MIRYISLVTVLFISIVVFQLGAVNAAEYNEGDPCDGMAGAWHQKNDANGVYFLVCYDDPVTDFFTKALDFTDLGMMKLPIINGAACDPSLAGSINYSSAPTPLIQFCNGSSWVEWGSTLVVSGDPPSYSGPGGTAAGVQGELQFNVDGTLLGGVSQLYWNDGTSRLGINTTTPATVLHIGTGNGQWTAGGLSFGGGTTGIYESAANTLALRTNGGDRVFINATGMGVGVTPAARLDVAGDIYYTGILMDTSDRRTKENIKSLEGSLEKISRLDPVSFTRIGENPDELHLGLIAQDVQEIYPELVQVKDENGTLGVSYVGLIAPLIQAVKELKEENAHLSARIKELEQLNDE
jgi:hypothetical protein